MDGRGFGEAIAGAMVFCAIAGTVGGLVFAGLIYLASQFLTWNIFLYGGGWVALSVLIIGLAVKFYFRER